MLQDELFGISEQLTHLLKVRLTQAHLIVSINTRLKELRS